MEIAFLERALTMESERKKKRKRDKPVIRHCNYLKKQFLRFFSQTLALKSFAKNRIISTKLFTETSLFSKFSRMGIVLVEQASIILESDLQRIRKSEKPVIVNAFHDLTTF